jgi:hypothetical protein
MSFLTNKQINGVDEEVLLLSDNPLNVICWRKVPKDIQDTFSAAVSAQFGAGPIAPVNPTADVVFSQQLNGSDSTGITSSESKAKQEIIFSDTKTTGKSTGLDTRDDSAAYQIIDFGGALLDTTPTGLADDTTTYSFSVKLNTGVDTISLIGSGNQTMLDLLDNINASANGYMVINEGGNLRFKTSGTGSDKTIAVDFGSSLFRTDIAGGTFNDPVPGESAVKYTISVEIDGVAVSFETYGNNNKTYTTLLSTLNAGIGASATASLINGNLVIESNDAGSSHSVKILDASIFEALSGFESIGPEIPGKDSTTYTAKITVGSSDISIALQDSTITTFDDLVAKLNTELTGKSVVSIVDDKIHFESSNSDKISVDSSFFKLLTGYDSVSNADGVKDVIDFMNKNKHANGSTYHNQLMLLIESYKV